MAYYLKAKNYLHGIKLAEQDMKYLSKGEIESLSQGSGLEREAYKAIIENNFKGFFKELFMVY